jgi:cytochrome c oxidase cbb3-type subunit 3
LANSRGSKALRCRFRRTEIEFIAILLLPAALLAQVPKPENPLGNGTEVVAAGRSVYNQTCTECHGRDGSEGERAPALAGNRRFFRLSEASIFDTIKKGIPGTAMPALGLSDDDIWRIVAYIRNLRGTASDSIVAGNVGRGAIVFQGKGGCQQCHMIRGQGGTIGPDLSSIGAEVTLKHLLEALTQERAIPNGYRPVRVIAQNGEVVEGVAKNEDEFSIQILDNHGQLHLYDKSELREIVRGKKSLMPHDLDKKLTGDEFQDLVAMLSRQARNKVHIEEQGESEIGR